MFLHLKYFLKIIIFQEAGEKEPQCKACFMLGAIRQSKLKTQVNSTPKSQIEDEINLMSQST